MKTIYSLPIYVLMMTVAVILGKMEQTIPVKGYQLFWNDEFDGRLLDQTKWNYRGLGKRDEAFITGRTVSLDGKGHAVIVVKASRDSILTGMIATEHIFETRYGYFECRASLTKTAGTFPAFWLQSPRNGESGTPDSHGAELDIFEYFPHTKKDSVAHTMHWSGYGNTHKVAGPVWGALQKTKDGFHTFGLEWTPDSYTTFVDGKKTCTGTTFISKVPEFIVLSVGINKAAAGPVDTRNLPDSFVIDYIRVYKRKGDK